VIKLFEYGFGIRIFGQFYHQQLNTSFYHLALFVFIALGILNQKMADNNNNDCKDVKTVEKRTKSLVWDYFTKINNEKEAQCHVCRDLMAYKGTTSTSASGSGNS
jgi:hypothetical protein